jgi:adenosylmethionine-8-amino-7-oxononanoate aminotransferase
MQPNIFAVHRDWDRPFPVIVRAEGIYLYDADGRRYIDGSGGSAVITSIGHGVKEVVQAMSRQAERLSYNPTHAFTTEPYLELGELVASLAPGTMRGASKMWAACTGTDATDDAARLARQYWVERGQPSKYVIIARWQAFHGNNLGVAGFSGLTTRRRPFQPMFIDMPHIPPAFCYRCYFEKTYPDCNLLCARALETAIRQTGPENIAAFIAEPVVGASLAAAPAPDGYFQLVRQICDRCDVLFIADEVMTGWGRTGRMWGIDYWGVTPDIVAVAKGMTGGYTPLSAIIAGNEIWEPLQSNHSPFKAGHSFNANPVSCAGTIAVLRYLVEHKLVDNAREQGTCLLDGLRSLMAKHTLIGDVRGRGLMVGMEFVKDRATKEPFPAAQKVARMFGDACLARGLVVYPCTGSVDGALGDMAMLAPPLVITRAQIDEIVAILDEAIDDVERKCGMR